MLKKFMMKKIVYWFAAILLSSCSRLGIHEVQPYKEAKSIKPMVLTTQLNGRTLSFKSRYPIPKLKSKPTKNPENLIKPPNLKFPSEKIQKQRQSKTSASWASPIEKVMSAID